MLVIFLSLFLGCSLLCRSFICLFNLLLDRLCDLWLLGNCRSVGGFKERCRSVNLVKVWQNSALAQDLHHDTLFLLVDVASEEDCHDKYDEHDIADARNRFERACGEVIGESEEILQTETDVADSDFAQIQEIAGKEQSYHRHKVECVDDSERLRHLEEIYKSNKRCHYEASVLELRLSQILDDPSLGYDNGDYADENRDCTR